ncbi:low temperature requirement protein A [Roseibium aggregatum]|uniref:Low temperature requirement protein A n=1 Tax=Roseibium aggregatum TaxID=187304 RepID=A0A926P2I2_9HYPH|nr:low temperature requirement protein A [Roseibium aggregatum]MBD1547903.1 low temperature requirement protein A [Roseibium aggregatum]
MSLLYRPLIARNPAEAHRAATPLELLFDLVSVIAIAAAAAGLHHAVVEAHTFEGVITFLMAFFAIWWAWMNYTWFASAYDNDDMVFRLLTMVIMAGSLTMAAGINVLVETGDLAMVVIGYVIMRVGMIAFWLRAAASDRKRQATAIAYAVGIGLVQIFWIVAFIPLQPLAAPVNYGLFLVGVVLELTVPVIAERKSTTPWHRHHIIERYGLLNIIVLGETLLSGAMSLQQLADGTIDFAFIDVAVSALVIVFSMWWLYFSAEDHLETSDLNRALIWGYGHYIIFASGAAVGVGFAILVDVLSGHGHASLMAGTYAVAVPVALYMVGLWFVRDRFTLKGSARFSLPVFAVPVLLAPLTPVALEGIAGAVALSVISRNCLAHRAHGIRNPGSH